MNTPPPPNRSQACAGITVDPWDNQELRNTAFRLGDELSLPVADPTNEEDGLWLAVTPGRLEIRQRHQHHCGRWRPIYVDLTQLDTSSPAGRSSRQPMAKAVAVGGIQNRPVRVIDATAGYGADTWLLASIGCDVTAYERCPIIAALLRDGLRRAAQSHATIASRVRVIIADASEAMPAFGPPPDVVYLDTMFPPKRKSALERRPMRVLRQIVGGDTDGADLFDAAVKTATSRVVVKRPLHAEPLAARPTFCLKGKSLRYDVYTGAYTHRPVAG